MAIIVKFFASLREEVGKSEVQMETPDSLTVAQVWAQVCDNAPLPAHVLMAVNMEYANQDAPVKNGDEVAFFPPVTGG
ncbi:MAG: molybdopterin converting factor subunit 1 [Candidatus Parabeggiatoa sp. nov. 2]|nr:MAG: molybdopterin converting factor subunit 1 [Beggiatoa sp. 4572_84]RKZ57456.1 MAG: molybdopterin converting factor subunit 1 [Gammaproteobacteria bacterium]HEC84102.1 molybdopterin converting factor subunit 1 [Thioploca sp.]